MKCLIAFILILISAQTFAGTIDPEASDQKHIDYGSKFKNVVRIKGICSCDKNKVHEFLASAVIIKPHWALTAAHVVKDGSDVKIVVGEKIYPVTTFVHENFEEKNFGHNDIALCYSEEDFGLDFYPDIYTEDDEQGKVASLAGYGGTGNFSSGAVKSDGLKRGGSNIINRIERKIIVCTLDDKRTELEFLIAHGDSGGGLFIANKLAGIHTFVMADDGKPNSDYGDESGHTRTSLYVDWMNEKTSQKISK